MDTIKIKSSHPASQGEFVIINASDFDPERHERYDAPLLPPPGGVKLSPPPGGGALDPLAAFVGDWREKAATKNMKAAVLAVTGRTVENRDQAIAVITAELAKRAA